MAEPLVKGQRVFAAHLSAQTGLDPRVVGAWLKSEQSGSAAAGYEKRGYYDWLNIANTDSGPASGANSSAWKNPVSAAKATAEWIRGQGQIAREYGKPAAGIQAILHTAGQSPQAQIKAIGSSGWATAPDYGSKIEALFHELAGDHGLVHEAEFASAPGSYNAHSANAAGLAGALAPTLAASRPPAGPNAAQTSDILQLLQGQLSQGQQGSSLASTPLARPQSSGGPEQGAATPRVPSAPVAGPAEDKTDAALSLLSKLTQDSTSEAEAAPEVQGQAQAPVHPEVANGEALHPDKVTQLKGLTTFDGKPVAAWIGHILQYVESKGVKPEVESGYRSEQKQQEIWDSGVRPAAEPGHSKHELKAFPGGAVDLKNAQAVAKVLEHSPYAHLLVYAGSKDPVHFSHPVNGTY